MPRLKPDMTILIREKDKKKHDKLEIFFEKKLLSLKYNNAWYKKRLKITKDDLKILLSNTLNSKIE